MVPSWIRQTEPRRELPKDSFLHELLAELKQECLARGLETKGIKQDLINRLQAYLEEHAEEEANEEDVLGDETEEEEPKPIELPVKEEEPPEKTVDVAAEKKVVKITSEMPQTERMQKRAERFNVPVSLESKKAARAARFGISSVPSKGKNTETSEKVNLDKLKERAQRFGLNVSSISRKSGDDCPKNRTGYLVLHLMQSFDSPPLID
uniref:SAP domain-containing ribonucleoprotein n=1 Tax=Sus scrofa TaxID=9823 RepID=A0A5G2QAZ5_PIG